MPVDDASSPAGARGTLVIVSVGVAQEQAGVVSRRQLLAEGWTPARIRAQLTARRWQRIAPGVYATFSGPLPAASRVWAALLRAGPGAAAGPLTTLWLAGASDRPPERLDVVVPAERRVCRPVDLDITRRRALGPAIHPAATPPRLRIENALVDATAGSDRAADVVDLVLRVVQRRLTTAARLRAVLDRRRAHPWRQLLIDVLADVVDGVRSPLEQRWLRQVARPHGLPEGRLNHADRDDTLRYRDVDLSEWGLILELDGREAHPDAERFRDRRRDNRVAVSGRQTLRYGWREIAADPCGVAAEVAHLLQAGGWPGRARPCGPGCSIAP